MTTFIFCYAWLSAVLYIIVGQLNFLGSIRTFSMSSALSRVSAGLASFHIIIPSQLNDNWLSAIIVHKVSTSTVCYGKLDELVLQVGPLLHIT